MMPHLVCITPRYMQYIYQQMLSHNNPSRVVRRINVGFYINTSEQANSDNSVGCYKTTMEILEKKTMFILQ